MKNDDQSSTSFNKYLKQLGGWPVLRDNWSEDNFDWTKTIIKIDDYKYWYNGFLSLEVKSKLTSKKITPDWEIFIHTPDDLKATSTFLLNDKNDGDKKNYLDYMIKMAIHFGANEKHAQEELKKVLEFELKLVNILKPKQVNKKRITVSSLSLPNIPEMELSQSMSLSELNSKYLFFPWNEYIKNWLPVNVTLDDVNDKLFVLSLYYLDSINELIQSSLKKTLANYVVWKKIDAYASYLDKTTRNYHDDFYKITRRLPEDECLSTVATKLPLLTSAIYARDNFDEKTGKNINEIGKIIRNELLNLLNDSNWMDDEDKKKAVEKLESTSIVIGYPKELLDASILGEYYKDLEFSTNGSYIENVLRTDFFIAKNEWMKLDTAINEKDYWMNFGNLVRTAQAAYDQSKNKLCEFNFVDVIFI